METEHTQRSIWRYYTNGMLTQAFDDYAKIKADLDLVVSCSHPEHLYEAIKALLEKHEALRNTTFVAWHRERFGEAHFSRATMPPSWPVANILEQFNRTIKLAIEHAHFLNAELMLKLQGLLATLSAWGEHSPQTSYENNSQTRMHVKEWLDGVWRRGIDLFLDSSPPLQIADDAGRNG